MKLRYKVRALRDLEAIHGFISQSDPVAAGGVVRRIERSINRLLILPMSGPFRTRFCTRRGGGGAEPARHFHRL